MMQGQRAMSGGVWRYVFCMTKESDIPTEPFTLFGPEKSVDQPFLTR